MATVGAGRARILAGVAAIAAGTVAAMAAAGALLPQVLDGPAAPPRPGTGYVNPVADGTCTLGFLAEDPAGRRGFLTAGHCGSVGDAALVPGRLGGWTRIGEFTYAAGGSQWADELDLGFIALDDPAGGEPGIADPAGPGEAGAAPGRVLAPAELAARRPRLCFTGQRSGRSCGPMTALVGREGSDVAFAAAAIRGDSGSPVYLERPGRAPAAVGLLSGVSEEGPALSFAELLAGPAAAAAGFRVVLG